MIDQKDVISFFDRCAPGWDAEMIRNEPVIRTILDNAGIRAGVNVLDVACGTGVLFPDYLARDVHSVTGVDIAPEMARRAAEKFPDARVTVLCGDIETVPLPQPFDCCMVYNAFPHFPDPARLIAHLATAQNRRPPVHRARHEPRHARPAPRGLGQHGLRLADERDGARRAHGPVFRRGRRHLGRPDVSGLRHKKIKESLPSSFPKAQNAPGHMSGGIAKP